MVAAEFVKHLAVFRDKFIARSCRFYAAKNRGLALPIPINSPKNLSIWFLKSWTFAKLLIVALPYVLNGFHSTNHQLKILYSGYILFRVIPRKTEK